jgi:hypothetical protein
MKRKLLLLLSFWILPLYFSLQLHTPIYGKSQEHFWAKSSLSLENVYAALIVSGVEHPEIVMRQVIVETMWLKCKNCSAQFNNLFGFYLNGKYMKFDSWYESVMYYKKWQTEYYKGGDYYAFLNRIGYATSGNYTNTLKQVILPELTQEKI